MDIKSGMGYPASKLSNFAHNKFIFDNIEIAGMEGLLQSFKFSDIEIQKYVCTLSGLPAKFKGKNKKWWKDQKLYWQGVTYDRHSKEYQDLLDRAYQELYNQNLGFRRALNSTRNAVLRHSIGKNDESHTVLTEQEFCSRLMKLREMGKIIEI